VFENEFEVENREKEIDIREILEIFSAAGWKYNEAENMITFEEDGKKMNIIIQNGFDRERIFKIISSNARHFICASEGIKNLILQECARHCYKTGKPLTLFVSTVKEFEERGNFEKIEFDDF